MKIKIILFLVLCEFLSPQIINNGLLLSKDNNVKIEFKILDYDKNSITVEANIPNGYYTYLDSKIAGKITFSSKEININTVYPKGVIKNEDTVLFGVQKFILKTDVELENKDYNIQVLYQLCSEKDNICLAPQKSDINLSYNLSKNEIKSVISSESSNSNNISSNIYSNNSHNSNDISNISFQNNAAPSNSSIIDNSLSYIKSGENIFITLLIIFLAGLASVLLPCTYPMLSITISILGGNADKKSGRNILQVLFFCLGVITTYTLLGAIVSLAGFMFHTTIRFGSLGYNPIVLSVLTLLFLYFTFSMAGFYEIKIPSFLSSAKSSVYSKQDASVFHKYIMGLLTGIVATPCAAPIIAVILEMGFLNPLYAVIYMATYALGFSSVLFILGSFVSVLSKLPKAGSWMVYVKYLFTFIMFLICFYYLQILFLSLGFVKLSYILSALVVILFSILVYLITRKNIVFSLFEKRLFLAVLVLSIIIGLGYGYIKSSKINSEGLSFDKALEISKNTGKDILIDFSAVWCANCYELKDNVFESDILKQYIEKNYIFVEIDVDKNAYIADYFNVKWLPWIIVIDSDKNIKYIKNSFESFNDKTALEIKKSLENINL